MYFVCYKLVFHVVAVFLFCLDTQFVRAVTFPWNELSTTEQNPVRAKVTRPFFTTDRWLCLGNDGSGSNKNDAWTLNLTSYAWTQLTTIGTKPSVRAFPSSILYNGQMIILGERMSLVRTMPGP